MPGIFQGCIVRADVTDPRGGNKKCRPIAIITRNSDIAKESKIIGVAITSQFVEPLQPDEVRLSWHPRGGTRTGLSLPCVAKCSWLCEIDKSDVIEFKGVLPPAQLEQILNRVGIK